MSFWSEAMSHNDGARSGGIPCGIWVTSAVPASPAAGELVTQSGRLKGWGVWEDHQARDRRDASTLDILATPQFRKRAQKSDRDDGQNELRNDSR
jgi:hypothetical protein